jgi:hypothetical protein
VCATSWSPVQGVQPIVLDVVTEVKQKVSWRRPRPELGCRAKGAKILRRLNFTLRKLNLIREGQHGFKKGHYAKSTLLRHVERIVMLGFNNNKITIALFLAIERAFDKMWITRLTSELIKASVSTHFMYIIRVHKYHQQDFHSRRPKSGRTPSGHPLRAYVV